MPDPETLDDFLRRHAAAKPEAIAVSFEGRDISFSDLDLRANRIANGLAAAGLRPGDRLALIAKNSLEWIEVLVGALRAGVVLVAVNWRLAPPEIAYVLEHAAPRALIFDPALVELFEHLGSLPDVRLRLGFEAAGFDAWAEAQSSADPRLPIKGGDVALQMYTSGTTGRPKGVQLTHDNYRAALTLIEDFEWAQQKPGEVVLAAAPFFHVNGVNPVLRALHAGSRLLTVRDFRPEEAIRLIATYGVTRTTMAPAMIQFCLAAAAEGSADLSSLRVVTYGGSPIAGSVLQEARAVFGCSCVQSYGMTESTGGVTFLQPEDHEIGGERLLSCGCPGKGAAIRVVRPDGTPCSPREIGEVFIGGETLTPGYFSDPGATAAALEDGWLSTGDAGSLDEQGFLYIHDRLKDMIISGGENVYPAEVEAALQAHPDVIDAAVVGIPDARWGEAVQGFVALKPGAAINSEGLRSHCRRLIAGYKIPKAIEIVDTIPRNPSGKILRRDLRAPFWVGSDRQVR